MSKLSEKAQYLRERMEAGGENRTMVTRLELETELLRADRSRRWVGAKEIPKLIREMRANGADIEELITRSRHTEGYLLKGWR